MLSIQRDGDSSSSESDGEGGTPLPAKQNPPDGIEDSPIPQGPAEPLNFVQPDAEKQKIKPAVIQDDTPFETRLSKGLGRCFPQTYLAALVLSQQPVVARYPDLGVFYARYMHPYEFADAVRFKTPKSVIRHVRTCRFIKAKTCGVAEDFTDVSLRNELVFFYPRLSARDFWLQERPFWGYDMASLRGRRPTNQDRLAVVAGPGGCYTSFALMDGHGGVDVAERASHNYGFLLDRCTARSCSLLTGMRWAVRILDAMISRRLHRAEERKRWKIVSPDEDPEAKVQTNQPLHCGTTFLSVTIWANRLLFGQVGDSEAFLYKGGFLTRRRYKPVRPLAPHNAFHQREVNRVQRAGGYIVYDQVAPRRERTNDRIVGRVQGALSVTRALGDPGFGDIVVGEPDLVELERTPHDDFIIMATDGLWDVMDAAEAGMQLLKFLYKQLELGHEASSIHAGAAKFLASAAMIENSTDNCSVCVVFLQPANEIIRRAIQAGDLQRVVPSTGDDSDQEGNLTHDDTPNPPTDCKAPSHPRQRRRPTH